jgi:hypothetical protein
MSKIKTKFYFFFFLLLIIIFPYFGGDHGPPRSPPPSVIAYSHVNALTPPVYDNPYESSVKFDPTGPYFDEYGGFGRSRSDLGSDPYGKQSESMLRYDSNGVYPYEGPKAEPYGARGMAPKSSTWASFDDYERSISFGYRKDSSVNSSKIVRAVPKAKT